MKALQIIERARREGVSLVASRNGVVQCHGRIQPQLAALVQVNSGAVWDALMEAGGTITTSPGRPVVDFEAERARRRPRSLRDRVRGKTIRDEPYLGPEGDAA